MLKGLSATFSLLVSSVHEYFMFLKMVMTAVLYLDYISSNLAHYFMVFFTLKITVALEYCLKI